jgi:hypothetical protein
VDLPVEVLDRCAQTLIATLLQQAVCSVTLPDGTWNIQFPLFSKQMEHYLRRTKNNVV